MDNNLNKQILLTKLSQLGIDPSSGRKHRLDKGQIRGPNSRIRSDKGSRRFSSLGKTTNPVAQYLSLKTRLLNRPADSDGPYKDYIVQTDQNNIFIPLVKHSSQKYVEYSVVSRSRKIARTVKHIAGYTTDLEKYRFNALQYLALNPSFKIDDKSIFKMEYQLTNTDNPFDLFCCLYHIAPEDVLGWTYEKWLSHYRIVADTELTEDFVFNPEYMPGSPEFMPELWYAADKVNTEQRIAISLTKEYKNIRARVYGLELSKAKEIIKQRLLAQPESLEWSMIKLEREINKLVDIEKINFIVDEFMESWVTDKLEAQGINE